MLLHAGNSWTKIVSANDDEMQLCISLLSYRTAAFRGKAQFKSLLKLDLFPAGLTRKLVRAVRERGFPVEIVHRAKKDLIAPGYSVEDINWVPREHQRIALDIIREHRRGLIQHATGCLSGDTIIECNRAKVSFKFTLRDLVKRMRGEKLGRGGGSPWSPTIPTTVRYRSEDGYIRLGRLQDAYYSGMKLTYTVTTACGKSIRATADHRFLTAEGWKKLGDVHVGEEVWVAGGAPTVTKKPGKPQYLVVERLWRHPHASRKNIKRGGWSVPAHRLVVEAAINRTDYHDYIAELRKKSKEPVPFVFLDRSFAVHHLDGNSKNNELDNLAVVGHKEHSRIHGVEGAWKYVTEKTVLSRIVSIAEHGLEETYDIAMEDEPHNFMANGFVVHNSGKGDLIGLLAALISGRVLIMAPSKKLQEDLFNRCKKFGVQAGRLGGGYFEPNKRVVVAVDDSLKRLTQKDLESFDALMCDECHQAAAKSYYDPLMKCKNAQIRLGFSATALDRADKKGLFVVGALGETIHRYTPDQAAKDGVIATAKLRMVRFWHSCLYNAEDYVDWDRQAIAEHVNRNLLLLRLIHSTDAPRIVFTRTKQHQTVLAEMVGKSDCATVNDQTPLPEMAKIIAKLRSGEIKTLISTPIFRQGVDIPELKTVINGAGGRATIDVIQKVGRGSRILQADGSRKETFDVYDINDLGCGCQGEIHKGCKWLHTHSADRKAAYEKYGYKVEDYSL